jgi:membrane associated rhomboid family serine protease
MATWVIVVLIVLASLGAFASPALRDRWVLRPYLVARGQQTWRVLTSAFIHADLAHLIFNLVTFFSFSFPLERAIGTPRLAILYVFGLLASNLGTCFQHRNEPDYASLGASGAISAVLFAAIVYFPGSRLVIFPIPVPIPAPLFAVLYLAYSYYSARRNRGRINHDAHIAGALAGLVFVALTDPLRFAALARYVSG